MSLTPKMNELFVSELGCSDQTSYTLVSKIMHGNVTYNPSHNATVIFQASCPFNIQYSWLFNSLRGLPKQPQCYNLIEDKCVSMRRFVCFLFCDKKHNLCFKTFVSNSMPERFLILLRGGNQLSNHDVQ